MFAVPAATPETIPVLPTVATPVLPLTHEPPPGVEDNVVVAPTQTDIVPEIAAGAANTVTVVVRAQPDTV